jgi:predicted alpha/beta hydrolase family esterase
MPESSRDLAKERCRVLLVPGIGNSGPEHWQSHWERQDGSYLRVQQSDWENPVCADWMETLEGAVQRTGPDVLIAAHSLGCLLVAHWLARTSCKVKGVFMVAVPDPNGRSFPAQALGFGPVPQGQFACPSLVVGSTDDPYGGPEFARQCARGWGSRFVSIGPAGHINAASGLGAWSEGHRLLEELMTGSPV